MIRIVIRLLGIVTIVLLAACSTAAEMSPLSQPRSGPDRAPALSEGPVRASISADQAERGRAAFMDVCAECHATNEFRNRDFLFRWGRRTAWDLFRNMRQNMPESLPGSLPDQVYVDVVAYVLTLNGYSLDGDELVPTEEVLDRLPVNAAQGDAAGLKGG